jgi:hypothetical protein
LRLDAITSWIVSVIRWPAHRRDADRQKGDAVSTRRGIALAMEGWLAIRETTTQPTKDET